MIPDAMVEEVRAAAAGGQRVGRSDQRARNVHGIRARAPPPSPPLVEVSHGRCVSPCAPHRDGLRPCHVVLILMRRRAAACPVNPMVVVDFSSTKYTLKDTLKYT